jgi:zinc transporter
VKHHITLHSLPEHEGLLYQSMLPGSSDTHPSENKGILWLHLCAIDPGTRTWLTEQTDLDEVIVDALLAEDTRPRFLVRAEGSLINIRTLDLHDDASPEKMISLRIWCDDQHIITSRRRDTLAIEQVMQAIEGGHGPSTTGQFVARVADKVYTCMESFIEDLENCISLTEEKLALDNYDNGEQNKAVLRRRIALFRRHIFPQKAMLEQLINTNPSWLDEDDIESLAESLDRVTRYTEELNDIRDRTVIANEEIRNLQANKLNAITYLFSVAATIFLPLSFLTGLLGINVGGIPGTEDDVAFWAFSSLCAAIIVGQIILFRKMKWF